MAGNAARLVLAVLLFDSCSPNAARPTAQAGDLTTNAVWALEVLNFDSTAPTVLWVGVVNRSGEPRLVCILDRGISFNDKDGTSKAMVEGGSPHACDVDEQYQLVRAGQTLFTRLTPETLPSLVSERIRVEVGVVERPVSGNASRRGPVVAMTWQGTLQDAADLGRALTDGPRKPK